MCALIDAKAGDKGFTGDKCNPCGPFGEGQGGAGALLGDKRQLTASRGSICQDCRQTGRSLRAIVPKAKPVVSIKKIVTVVMIQ